MRIAHLLATLIAVLAAVVLPCGAQEYNSSYSLRRSVRTLPPGHNNILDLDENESARNPRSWSKKWQDVMRKESGSENVIDCCPSVLEMVEPKGGKNQEDMYVELYSDGDNRQRFYEVSCQKEVENKPCRFIDRKMFNQSRCVQKFSYTYALVRDISGEHQRHQRHFPVLPGAKWAMDYIKIRSGCSCELKPHPRRHRKRVHKGDRKRDRTT